MIIIKFIIFCFLFPLSLHISTADIIPATTVTEIRNVPIPNLWKVLSGSLITSSGPKNISSSSSLNHARHINIIENKKLPAVTSHSFDFFIIINSLLYQKTAALKMLLFSPHAKTQIIRYSLTILCVDSSHL